ncbi:MAG: tRNA glutamyl-Q(34) synthetase GluQRS [Rhodocyclaceae bacterium]|nr:tRNA glutamyl-Q(34) synthetase GluQRS [Rhodocyclaceae bacterium]
MLPIYSKSRQSSLPVQTPRSIHPVVRGRYAPSPTGPLHFGSLVAAVGSFLEARCQGGEWLLRMEDVDEPRCRGPWADDILRTLEAFGFEWDGEVMVQSRRKARYQEALDALRRANHAYPCACTRKELESAPLAVDGAHLYPGTCRTGLPAGKPPRAWRLRVPDEALEFNDAVQGPILQNLATEAGDFVLMRADGYFAYQLAVVVDDADQGITHVVRGADLLDSTPRQIVLQRCLGVVTPSYAHLPVAVNEQGEKLSKQTLAAPLDVSLAPVALRAALCFLGQEVPEELNATSEIWAWAREHWQLERVPRLRGIPCLPYSR